MNEIKEKALVQDNGNPVMIVAQTYRGKEYLHVREYYKDRATGEFKPSKKGITVPFSDGERLIETVEKVLADRSSEDSQVDSDVHNPILVRISEWKGIEELDLRHHYFAGEELRPTKKGVGFPLSQADGFLAVLKQVVLPQPIMELA